MIYWFYSALVHLNYLASTSQRSSEKPSRARIIRAREGFSDDLKLVEELDGLNADSSLRRYTWQPDDVGLDVVLQMTDVPNAAHFFQLHDANKNVVFTTSIQGYVLEVNFYSPFGENFGGWVDLIGFSSEYHDKELNGVNYCYRNFIPNIGRWIAFDPINEKRGNNLYVFVKNNPVQFIDYLGLSTCKITINENVGPIPDGHGGWYSGETDPNLSCPTGVVNVIGKPNQYKILASTNCTIKVKYLGTGQELSWDKKTTIAEHETFHVKESETNFSDVIKLYEAADGKVVCGEKCARAITDYLDCYCRMKKEYNLYKNKKYDCEKYAPGLQRDRVCNEEKRKEEVYMNKVKECEHSMNAIRNACTQ